MRTYLTNPSPLADVLIVGAISVMLLLATVACAYVYACAVFGPFATLAGWE